MTLSDDQSTGRFDDYAVIPLALDPAPVDVSALRQFLQTRCHACAFHRNRIRYVLFYARLPIDSPRSEAEEDVTFDWEPTFKKQFGKFVAWLELLPFRRLHGIDFVTQTANISEHMDIFGANNSETYFRRYFAVEPRYYRMVIGMPGDRAVTTRSFFITERFRGARRFVKLPKDAGMFAMNSSCCYHGAKWLPGRFKTTVAVFGDLDERRHKELLRVSLSKHEREAIRLRNPGPVSGPGAVLPYRGPTE